MKRILAILIALVMLCSVFVACGGNEADPSQTESKPADQSGDPGSESAEPASQEESSEADPYAHLRNFDFEEEECIFLVNNDNGGRYKSIEILPFEGGSDVLNSAIEERNNFVEDLLHVVIKEVRSNNVLNDARNDIQGEGQYDILMPWMDYATTLASDASLYDLYSFSDIIHLDQPYWDQRANADLSFGNKLFFTTGDFSLLTYDCTHAIVFNKKLARDSGCDDMYQLLKDDNWTFDTLWSNAKLVTADTNGVDGMTYEDTWGFYLNQNFTTSMFIGSGERLTNKDNDDIPQLAPLNDRYSAVVDKIRQIYNDKTSTIIIEDYQSQISGKDSDVYSAASRATGEGRALFRSLAMVDLSELDAYDVEYGLLPVPKYNADQEEYYNIVSAFLASCICIHNQVEDPEMSAAVAEAIAISSTSTVRRAYYDTILKGRRIPDEDGEFALDTIFNNRVYEIATIYKFGNLRELIQTCARSSTDILVSTYTSMEGSVNAAIEDLKDTFDSID
ncbi:MAG: extracellular solute-binding protein [Clostridia bacterium]|nr:extracellular solute-binding protein [Clostridia bacterium]